MSRIWFPDAYGGHLTSLPSDTLLTIHSLTCLPGNPVSLLPFAGTPKTSLFLELVYYGEVFAG